MARRILSTLITAAFWGAIGFGVGVYATPSDKADEFRAFVNSKLDEINGLMHRERAAIEPKAKAPSEAAAPTAPEAAPKESQSAAPAEPAAEAPAADAAGQKDMPDANAAAPSAPPAESSNGQSAPASSAEPAAPAMSASPPSAEEAPKTEPVAKKAPVAKPQPKPAVKKPKPKPKPKPVEQHPQAEPGRAKPGGGAARPTIDLNNRPLGIRRDTSLVWGAARAMKQRREGGVRAPLTGASRRQNMMPRALNNT